MGAPVGRLERGEVHIGEQVGRKKRWKHVYVVYRLDHYLKGHTESQEADAILSIKSVHASDAAAADECERLNALVKDGGREYKYQVAKIFEEIPFSDGES